MGGYTRKFKNLKIFGRIEFTKLLSIHSSAINAIYIYNCKQSRLDAKWAYLAGECAHHFSLIQKQVLFSIEAVLCNRM
jgi:hypothetical protein